jgi:hypothetical protein
MYTNQQSGVYDKIKKDIEDCLDKEITGIDTKDISKIIHCNTYSNLHIKEQNILYNLCKDKNINLEIKSISEIATDIYNTFPSLAKDFLGIKIGTNQILELEEFILKNDNNEMSSPLKTTFQSRTIEKNEIIEELEKNKVVTIHGSAGVGKTRIAIECCQEYSKQKEYELYCIKSNDLPIYDDLKSLFESPGKYLLLVDDADQIVNLSHILEYINEKQKVKVKILITVRDYAKSIIQKNILKYTIPKEVLIGKLTDEEITELLEKNLEILNSYYLEKIVKIAEGNARLAMLAGKLAKEKGKIESIRDASTLYESYYGNFLSDDLNEKMITVLGSVAFYGHIDLDNLDFLDFFPNINEKEYLKCLNKAYELELVNIYADKKVKVEDDAFGNYVLKKMFIEYKKISLSFIINNSFENNKERVIYLITTLINVFQSQEVYNLIEKEINKSWTYFKNEKNEKFFEFVKAFHVFNSTDTFIILKDKIDKLDYEEFDIIKEINFESLKRNNFITDEILEILNSYSDNYELETALDLLFEYYSKKPSLFIGFYNTLKRLFEINKNSLKHNYYTQKMIINKFIESSENWENEKINLLFINLSSEMLESIFSPIGNMGNKTFTIYKIPLQYCEGLEEYRTLIWKSLLKLYEKKDYKEYIEKIIDNHYISTNELLIEKDRKKIATIDLKYIEKFFNEKFEPNDMKHCIIAERVLKIFKKYDVNLEEKLKPYIENDRYKLVSMLNKLEQKRENIEKYASKLKKKDIPELMNACKEYIDITQKSYKIGENLKIIFQYLFDKPKPIIYRKIIESYIQNDTPSNIHPDHIIKNLLNYMSHEKVFDIINKSNYDQKEAWIFSYYKNFPDDYLSNKYCKIIYEFIKYEKIKSKSCHLRDLIPLNRYNKYCDDIFLKISKLILKKSEKDPFILKLYFESMFFKNEENPEDLFILFKKNIELIEKIYFQLLKNNNYIDYDGKYLKAFLEKDNSFIKKYMKFLIEREEEDLQEYDSDKHDPLKKIIWENKNYIEIMDEVIVYLNNSTDNYIAINILSNLIKYKKNEYHIDKWIENYITENSKDKEKMGQIFNIITELTYNRQIKHIITFTKINNDYQLFSELKLESREFFWIGSEIPFIEKKIKFLNELLKELKGSKYLKHRKKLEDEIKYLKIKLEKKQLKEILE